MIEEQLTFGQRLRNLFKRWPKVVHGHREGQPCNGDCVRLDDYRYAQKMRKQFEDWR